MFRALLWKEWRQLRVVRWLGMVIALALPGLLLLLFRFWASGYGPSDVLGEMMSYVVPFVVPLFALVATTQAFWNDRETGTEHFLLEFPVRRSSRFFAKLVCAVGTTVQVALVMFLAWVLVAFLADVDSKSLRIALVQAGGRTSPGVGMITATATASAILASSPMASALLTYFVASLLVTVYTFRHHRLLLNSIVPLIVICAGFLVASYTGFCLGEPAGRWRIARTITVMAAAFVLSLAVSYLTGNRW
jgi:ABC-type transport system involved in multi-copper enzyme maturation permease subunit